MKEFPFAFETDKPVSFYPQKPAEFRGDVLEVGPGRGDLLLNLAKENPLKRFVAIEMGKKRYHRLIPRIEKSGLTNILLIRGDARVVLPRFFSENTFHQTLILFPDPWPKDRHTFHRLLTCPFLLLLTHQLKKDGTLITATDHAPYAADIKKNLDAIPRLTNALAPQHCASSIPDFPETFFQQKWLKEGKENCFFKYCKV